MWYNTIFIVLLITLMTVIPEGLIVKNLIFVNMNTELFFNKLYSITKLSISVYNTELIYKCNNIIENNKTVKYIDNIFKNLVLYSLLFCKNLFVLIYLVGIYLTKKFLSKWLKYLLKNTSISVIKTISSNTSNVTTLSNNSTKEFDSSSKGLLILSSGDGILSGFGSL